MDSSAHRPPWSFFAGVVIALLGASTAVASQFGGGLPLAWPMAAMVVGAGIELATGLSLQRKGGAWMAQLFSGVLLIGAVMALFSARVFEPSMFSLPPVALLLAIYCTSNALFRALDLIIDQPRAAISESVDIGVTLALGVLLLGHWRVATLSQVGLAAGVELLAGGFAIAASAAMAWRHPGLSPYDGKQERLLAMIENPRR